MKIAVIGPVCKDEIEIDGKKHIQMGSIPFYIGKALKSLGVDCTLFITHGESDTEWVKENLQGINTIHIHGEKTLVMKIKYSSKNPDKRIHKTDFTQKTIEPEHVMEYIDEFDYIIMGPLFYGDINPELFKLLEHKKVVLGNFGMFTYPEEEINVKKHPERAIKVLPYVDYLFLDEEEIMFLAQKETVQDAVEELKKYVDNIIVTKGTKGSEVHIGKEKYDIPAHPLRKIEDPTGAGDTYLAAFIAGLQIFDDVEKTAKFAAMAATVCIETKGPMQMNKKEILQRLGWNL